MVSFNLPNIITITIMGVVGYAALGLIAQLIKRQQGAAGMAGG